MPGTKHILDFRIILGALIRVFNIKSDGSTGGDTFEDAGKDTDLIRFLARRRGNTTLSGLRRSSSC